MTSLLRDSVPIDKMQATFKSGVMVINYSSEFSGKLKETGRGGGEAADAWEATRQHTDRNKGLPRRFMPPTARDPYTAVALQTERLRPPRQISLGGYYRPEDEMIFRERSFHTQMHSF